MSHSTSSASEADQADWNTWPWQCLDCETTIYDDRDYCQDCDSAHSLAVTDGGLPASEAFIPWMCSESYPSFILKISAVSATELVLTAVWLQILLGPSDFLQTALIFI